MRRRRRLLACLLAVACLSLARAAEAQLAISHEVLTAATPTPIAEAGWRHRAGDDARWAAPDWDDRDWTRLRSTAAGLDPTAPPWTGIGWYRLRIEVADDAVAPVALMLWHWGASEVYLDGERVGGFGRVSATATAEQSDNPRWRAVILPMQRAGPHVLAVRYSAWPQVGSSWRARWLRAVTPPGLNVRVRNAATYVAVRDEAQSRHVALLVALTVAFVTFAVLHLLYWGLERHDRQNLAFGGYAAALTGIFAWQVHRELVPHSVLDGAVLQTGLLLLRVLLGLSLVAFTYASRRLPTPRAAIAIAALQAALAFGTVLAPETRWYAPLGAACQLLLIGLAAVGALRSGADATQGRTALSISVLAGSGPLVLTAFETFGVPLAPASRTVLIQGALASVLLLASIAQARRYAITTRELRARVEHIRELSARERERDRAEADARAERDRERAEAERQARELEEARAFQLSLLPSRLPELTGWEAVASMRTASEVGGDYFDVRRMANGVATLVIGDATGHGLRAGTLVATTKGLFQAVGDHEDLGVALQVMAAALRDLRLRGLFMALTIVRLHPDGRVEVATAGMPPALLLSADGRVTSLDDTAPPLGAPVRFGYRTRTVTAEPGDRLLLMTDGVPERLDGNDDVYGYSRIPELARRHLAQCGADYIKAIEADFDAFAGRAPADDATLLVISRN